MKQIKNLVNEAQGILLTQGISHLNNQSGFNSIIRFYEENDVEFFDEHINYLYINHTNDLLAKNNISKHVFNQRIRCIAILEEVYSTNSFDWKVIKKETLLAPSCFKESITNYLSTRCLSKRAIDTEFKALSAFNDYLIDNRINNPNEITPKTITQFLDLESIKHNSIIDKVGTGISKYLSYLYQNNFLDKDLSFFVKVKVIKNRKVKKAMPKDILKKLLLSIDRSTPVGKRDFAIISLSIATGLRAGDIINIELKDINWKNKTLSIVQGKNSSYLELPLDNNVCNILSDYILEARPQTECKKLFIRSIAPFRGFIEGVSINNMLKRRFKKIGIESNATDGLTIHGIRRMVATEMIRNQYPVDIVSQVLGHSSIVPTKQYISLDLDGLKKCTLSLKSLSEIL